MNPLRDHRVLIRGGDKTSSESESAQLLVAKVIEDRACGIQISDEQVISSHPELAEALRTELQVAGQLNQAMLAARRFGLLDVPHRVQQDSRVDSSEDGTGHKDDDVAAIPPRIPGFLLTRELGRGGQAIVYLALQESTQKAVAIKVISGGSFASSRHRSRFEREVRMLAEMEHPNIVSIIDRGRTSDGSFFFAMPYIEGVAADDYWARQTGVRDTDLRKLVVLFAKLAKAVAEAHARGIVHRDLKPSNVIVDAREEPHLLDFGLAKPVEGLVDVVSRTMTISGQIIGSLPWASPEQAAGQSNELGPQSDVYSIGVMLYQAVAGTFPYSLEGPVDQVLLRIRRSNPKPPSKQPGARFGTDRGMDAIVLKALSKNPEERYPSAGSFALDLESWLADKPLLAKSASSLKRKWLITSAILIALGAIGGRIEEDAVRSSAPVIFNLPSINNSVGMMLVKMPAGRFLVGSMPLEEGRSPNEHQRPKVIDHPFYIETTTVTQDQYEQVMHENPSDPRWRGRDFPVQNVTWDQAVEFCRRLSETEHANYRLPTEIEWEYACRANSNFPFSDPHDPELTLYCSDNSGGAIHPVKQKEPNVWGLYDMQGNVYQWCSNLYGMDMDDPPSPSKYGNFRSIRGGSAVSQLTDCRAASRNGRPQEFRNFDIGFRVIRDP